MKIELIAIRNFRRLEDVNIGIEGQDTIFVGPNNSGKTSATAIFRSFLGQRSFRVHDFSVSKIAVIDAFGLNGDAELLPAMELDIWFKVDPDSIEFGRAFPLLPDLSDNFERLGVRLSYQASNPAKMREAYTTAYPATGDQPPAKRLSEFLGQDGVLGRHYRRTRIGCPTVDSWLGDWHRDDFELSAHIHHYRGVVGAGGADENAKKNRIAHVHA